MSNCYNKQESGFSLIEVMVAFVILTTALVGMSGSFPFGLNINKESENGSAVSYAAQQKLEEIISLPYSTIATGTIEVKHEISPDIGNGAYKFERETIVTMVDNNLLATSTDMGLKKIDVTVYYINAISRKSKSITTTTLVSKKQ